ncbi:MAG TPA: thiol-disulfide isomerase [Candidatus Angelobacter sp.]|nr:thiol-disulfide isomerase [Candidatus Angelobacter sp.]
MMRLPVAVFLLSMAAMAADTSSNPITFNKDVLPILQNNCQSCHRPNQIAPMAFLTYQDVRPWAQAIKAAVLTKKMPPWFADPRYGHFSNERKLSDADVKTLVRWADSGGTEGDAKDKPAPREFPAEGWNIKPDLVFAMPKPYSVPSEGVIEYTYIVVPTGFTKDTWVTAAEVLPGNRQVTHHVIAFVRPPGSQWLKDAKPGEPFVPVIHKRDANGAGAGIDQRSPDPQARARTGDSQQPGAGGNEFLVAYVPGIQPQTFNLTGDSAKLIPAGSDIVFQMHYTPNGTAQTDVTKVGLVLAKGTPKSRYLTIGATTFQFAIPANDPNYEVHSQVTFEQDAQLVWLQPHMHLRGKDFEYRLVYPTGETDTALKVPNYSFSWQLGYDEAKPLALPKGTRMECTAHFDNSINNPDNPNPNVVVKWGDQSWEEMMIGWFGVVVDASADPSKIVKRMARQPAPAAD